MKRAVVLVSGGIDSAVALYLAAKKYECFALTFDYGQRLIKEIACARRIAGSLGAGHTVVKIALPWKGSALLDKGIKVPPAANNVPGKIPGTYVPARNMIFLSFAVSYAEAVGADKVFIGAHQHDYSNYPDCRKGFLDSFEMAVNKGTKAGVEKNGIRIEAPLLNMTKKEIIKLGLSLGVPFQKTWSCYKGGKRPCLSCESCMFRVNAFRSLGMEDPILSK